MVGKPSSQDTTRGEIQHLFQSLSAGVHASQPSEALGSNDVTPVYFCEHEYHTQENKLGYQEIGTEIRLRVGGLERKTLGRLRAYENRKAVARGTTDEEWDGDQP